MLRFGALLSVRRATTWLVFSPHYLVTSFFGDRICSEHGIREQLLLEYDPLACPVFQVRVVIQIGEVDGNSILSPSTINSSTHPLIRPSIHASTH